MAKYRRKPLELDAIQWTGDNDDEITEFTKKGMWYSNMFDDILIKMKISYRNPQGLMTVPKGDWIIKGVDGEFYPCEQETFDKLYDVVPEPKEEAPND
jgi:hypothetical protein